MTIRHFFRQAEMLPSPVTRRESLEAGFSFGYVWKFDSYPFEAMASLDPNHLGDEARAILTSAANLGISFVPNARAVNRASLSIHHKRLLDLSRLIGVQPHSDDVVDTSSQGFKKIRDALERVSKEHEAWFRAGMYTFSVTWQLGFELVALSTEEARATLQRDDVKKITSNLAGAFEDLGWAPDRIETFFVEKVAPFLWEENLRKWTFDLNMAVMSDLRHEAAEGDKKNEPSGAKKRMVLAAKALVEGVPVVGKAAAALLWGEKTK